MGVSFGSKSQLHAKDLLSGSKNHLFKSQLHAKDLLSGSKNHLLKILQQRVTPMLQFNLSYNFIP